MNTVNFFGHAVTRLIIGDNPMSGHSYIEDVTPGSEMIAYYTAEKIKEALFRAEALGYNTMLPLADPYMIRVLQEYRRDGGKLQFIFQPYMAMNQDVSIRQMASVEPIGVYHQGTTTDFLYESGRCEEIRGNIEKYRALGCPVGIGTHRPDVIEMCEKDHWNVDFYMACMHNARRNREGEQSGFITGKTKSHLIFYPEDRPVMLETLKMTEKPVIAFKIFGGGQMFLGKSPEEKRQLIMGAYEEVFSALKPNDLAAIGVFQRDSDQLRENMELYNRWYEERQA